MFAEAITFSDRGSKNIFQSNEINDGRLSSLFKECLIKTCRDCDFIEAGWGVVAEDEKS